MIWSKAPMSLVELDRCVDLDAAGAKARVLARARTVGLEVPDGVVILDDGPVDRGALEAALARLGAQRWVVRSSSSIEDRPGMSGAGVFESVVGVTGADGVLEAIDRVRASGSTPSARAYLEAHGLDQGAVRLAVLVQPLIAADGLLLGVAHSDGDGYLVEERPATEPEWSDVTARRLETGGVDPLSRGLDRLSELLGCPIDAEFARAGEHVTFLQARPLVVAPMDRSDVYHVEGTWRLDAEHNPEPLSPAQQGLVAMVDAADRGPAQKVIGGYLYYSTVPRGRGSGADAGCIAAEELPRQFRTGIAPWADAQIKAARTDGTLEGALSAYGRVYERYVGEVSPALRAARQKLDDFLRRSLGESLSRHGALLGGLGGVTLERDQSLWQVGRAVADRRRALLVEHLERFGMYAPAWDVSVPCDAEAPERALAAALVVAEDG